MAASEMKVLKLLNPFLIIWVLEVDTWWLLDVLMLFNQPFKFSHLYYNFTFAKMFEFSTNVFRFLVKKLNTMVYNPL